MLTYEDCLGLCSLAEDEIEAIAEHEHIPEIVALEMGQYIVQREDGIPCIKRIILDDIEVARARGHESHALALEMVLHRFVEAHPGLPVPQPH